MMALADWIAIPPRWLYHWGRDVAPETAQAIVKKSYPDPWAIELINDLGLPGHFATGLYNVGTWDHTDHWHATLALWTVDYYEHNR